MKARQNAHARRNHDETAIAALPVPASLIPDVTDYHQSAYRYLESLDFDQELPWLSQIVDRFPELPFAAENVIVRSWWDSDDLRLRLAAAFRYVDASTQEEPPSREELRAFFSGLLSAPCDSRITLLATAGLAQLYARYVNRKDNPAEFECLVNGLSQPQTRHAALIFLDVIRSRDFYRHWTHSVTAADSLERVAADPTTSVSDALRACDLRCGMGRVSRPAFSERLIAFLGQSDISEKMLERMLDHVLASDQQNLLAKALPTLSANQAVLVFKKLKSKMWLPISWRIWSPLLQDETLDPAVRAEVIGFLRRYTRGTGWSDFLDLARRPETALPIRAALYQALLEAAHDVELDYPDPPLINLLLDLAQDPAVLDWLDARYEWCPLGYGGEITPEQFQKLIAMLHDPNVAISLKREITGYLCVDHPLCEEDARALVEIQFAWVNSLATGHRASELLWRMILQHVQAHPALGEEILVDPRTPSRIRESLWEYVPREALVRFAQTTSSDDYASTRFMKQLIKHLPPYLQKEWTVAIERDSDTWREFLARPALASAEAGDLLTLSNDPTAPASLRWLAAEWCVGAAQAAGREPQPIVAPGAYATLSTLAAALVQDGDGDPSRMRDVIARLRRVEIPTSELRPLVCFLARHSEEALVELVTHPELSEKQRQTLQAGMLVHLDADGLSWSSWQRVLAAVSDDSFSADAIRIWGGHPHGNHWSWFLELARDPQLPLRARRELVHVLWNRAGDIEAQRDDPSVSAMAALLDLLDAPDVGAHAFDPAAFGAFHGAVRATEMTRVLTALRNPAVPLPNRWLLARAIPLGTHLSDAELRLVIEARLDGRDLVPRERKESFWDELCAWARESRPIAQQLVSDPRVPIRYRGRILIDLPRQDILRLFPNIESDWRVKQDLLDQLTFWLPQLTGEDFCQDALRNGEVWQGLRATPAFLADDPVELVSVVSDPEQPALLREVTSYWLCDDLNDSLEGQMRAIAALADVLQRSNTETSITCGLVAVLGRLWERRDSPGTLAPRLGDVLANSEIPIAHRSAILKTITQQGLGDHVGPIWSAVARSGDRTLRADLIEAVESMKVLQFPPDALVIADALRRATTQAEIDAAEQGWKVLAPLGEILNRDPLERLRVAANPSLPDFVRGNALRWFDEDSLDHVQTRRLWHYLDTPEGHAIWNTSENPTTNGSLSIRKEIINKLGQCAPTPDLRAIIHRGPEDSRWSSFAQLCQLPDHSLVARVLEVMTVPSTEAWSAWRETVRAVPEAALLVVHDLTSRMPHPLDGARLIDAVFARAKGQHARSAELTDALVQTIASPPQIRQRIADVLAHCRISSAPDSLPAADDLARIIRFAQAEAQTAIVAPVQGIDFAREPDLTPEARANLVAIPEDPTLAQVSETLRQTLIQKQVALLPELAPEQLAVVLQKTIAPAVLAAHYRRVHPTGLPLLAQAIRADASGEAEWKHWRFFRSEGRQQIAHLTDAQVERWSQDLEVAVGVESIPDEVRQAARQIRERFDRARRESEIPTEYADLLSGVSVEEVQPAQRVRDLRLLRSLLGQRLAGKPVVLPDDLRARLPQATRDDVVAAFPEQPPGEPDDVARQHVLTWRHRIDRAIDLLRLLHCDERALAKNRLRATGEDTDDHDESAVAHFKQMRYAFQRPATRVQRQLAESRSEQSLIPALDDAFAALQGVKTFATSKELVAKECSDFPTLIEIGRRPYGQGSCQNYASKSDLNRALLAYVSDAMTKAIVISSRPTPENPGGTPIARAIVRLGKAAGTAEPVLLIERAYAAGGESYRYEPLLQQAVREFAAIRGWRAAIPESSQGHTTAETIRIRIPASRNGVQYEDGSEAMIGDSKNLPTEEYSLRVRYLD